MPRPMPRDPPDIIAIFPASFSPVIFVLPKLYFWVGTCLFDTLTQGKSLFSFEAIAHETVQFLYKVYVLSSSGLV